MRSHPFYHYAATFWGDHVSNLSNPPDIIRELTPQFLNSEEAISRAATVLLKTHLNGTGDAEHFHSHWTHTAAAFGLDWALESLASEEPTVLDRQDGLRRTPLHIAAHRGFHNCVASLLQMGADWSLIDASGQNACHHAAMSGQLRATRTLIPYIINDTNIMVVDAAGCTPLDYAAKANDVNTVQYYLEIKSRWEAHISVTQVLSAALTSALYSRNSEILAALMNTGTDLKIGDHLLTAIGLNFEAAVDLLDGFGREVNYVSENQVCPVHVAAVAGNHNMLSKLLLYRAKPNVLDPDGRSALACAVESRDIEAAEGLISYDSETNALFEGGESTITYASRHATTDMFKLLENWGAKIPEVEVLLTKTLEISRGSQLVVGAVYGVLVFGPFRKPIRVEDSSSFSKPIFTEKIEEDVDWKMVRPGSVERDSNEPLTFNNGDEWYRPDLEFDSRLIVKIIERQEDQNPPSEASADEKASPGQTIANLAAPTDTISTFLATSCSTLYPFPDRNAPFMLIQDQIDPSQLCLGAIVTDPFDPLLLQIPQDQPKLQLIQEIVQRDVLVIEQSDYQSVQNRQVNARVRALFATANITTSQSTSSPAPKVSELRLINPESNVEKIL